MKCLKSLACAMLVSMAMVCAADDEASEVTGKIALNRQNQEQITACIDTLKMAYPALTTSIAALENQNLPEAIRLLGLAAADDQMGILSALLGSVQDVVDNCTRGQGPDEGEVLDEEAIYAELYKRQQLLDEGYVVTKSGEVIDFAELNRRNAQNAADNFAGDDSEQEES